MKGLKQSRCSRRVPPDRAIDLIGRTDLLTASAILRRATLFIGNDTGLMHIAAASGVPTLGLFGPSPIDQYAPWGPHYGRGAHGRSAGDDVSLKASTTGRPIR